MAVAEVSSLTLQVAGLEKELTERLALEEAGAAEREGVREELEEEVVRLKTALLALEETRDEQVNPSTPGNLVRKLQTLHPTL